METASDKLKDTFERYKEEIEKSIVRSDVGKAAWEGSSIEFIPNKDLPCQMECVSYCFTDFFYRFENIESIEQYCLIAVCDCETGRVYYEEYATISG